MENPNNRMEKEIKAPLVSESNSRRDGKGVEDQTMVYFSTFVAVCGSYAFGSCVSSLAFSLKFHTPDFRLVHDLTHTVYLSFTFRQAILHLFNLQSVKILIYL